MKPAGNETRIIRSNDGTPWGVFLAGGGSAEHEQGISAILRTLNIDPDGRMVAGRSMTAPTQLSVASGQVTRKYYLDLQKPKKQTDKVHYLALREDDLEPRERRIYNLDRYKLDTEITGAWSERAFKLASWNKEAADLIQALQDAAGQADLTLWVGNTPDNVNNPFSYMGMIIAITSRMPEEARKALEDSDEEARKLREAVEKTGIVGKIEKKKDKLQSWSSGPAYHALAPKWSSSLNSVGRNGETEKPSS